MIGSFVTRGVTMLLGYIYPAYECFKTVEQRRPNVEILRFWCQYWIIIALVTVLERFGDAFISWLPMYCEAKLAFIVYLWYPRTKGTTYIYTTFLRPYVTSHESEIDQQLNELRTRALDFLALYWQRSSSFIQVKFFEVLQYVAAQANRPAPPPPPPPPQAPQAPQAPQPPPNNFPQQPPQPPAPPAGFNPPVQPGGFYPPGYEATAPPVAAQSRASAPPLAAATQVVYPPPPPPVRPAAAADAAPYRQGFYPAIPGYTPPQPQAQAPRTLIEEIDLDEVEETEEVIRPMADGAAAVSTSSTSRYMTRSRQRATGRGNRNW